MTVKKALIISTLAIILTGITACAISYTKKTGKNPFKTQTVETKAGYTLALSRQYYPSRLIDKDTTFDTSSTWHCTVQTTVEKRLDYPNNTYQVFTVLHDLYNELDVNGRAGLINITANITEEQATQQITFDCYQIQYVSHTTDTITCNITWGYSVNNATIYTVTYRQVFRNIDPDNIEQHDIYLYYDTTYEKYVLTSQQWDGTLTEQNHELQSAYNEGSNDAYDYGWDEGYDTGYPEGWNDNTSLNTPIDIRGLMLNVLTMPFTFISQAFNVTMWEGTPYEINLSNLILSLIAIATILFIIKLFTTGFSAIGNYTGNRTNGKLDRKVKESTIKLNESKARLNDRTKGK